MMYILLPTVGPPFALNYLDDIAMILRFAKEHLDVCTESFGFLPRSSLALELKNSSSSSITFTTWDKKCSLADVQ